MQESDAKQAEEIMRFALFKEVLKRQRRKKRKLNNGETAEGKGGDGSEDETEGDSGDEPEAPARMSVPLTKAVPEQPSQDPIWGDDSQDLQMEVVQPAAVAGPADDGKIRPERYVFPATFIL